MCPGGGILSGLAGFAGASGRSAAGLVVGHCGAGQKWFRHGLVVGEIALATVLLTNAGLLGRSVVKILRMDPGLNPRQLASVRFSAELRMRVPMRELAARLAALPGTTAVGKGPIFARRTSATTASAKAPTLWNLGRAMSALGSTTFSEPLGRD